MDDGEPINELTGLTKEYWDWNPINYPVYNTLEQNKIKINLPPKKSQLPFDDFKK